MTLTITRFWVWIGDNPLAWVHSRLYTCGMERELTIQQVAQQSSTWPCCNKRKRHKNYGYGDHPAGERGRTPAFHRHPDDPTGCAARTSRTHRPQEGL